MKKKSIYFILFFFAFISCENNQQLVYNFQQKNWDFNNPVTFLFEIKDTTKTYDMSIFFRNNLNYPYQNLYLIIETQHNNNILNTDTLHYAITDKYGKWLGEGFGATKNNYFNYNNKVSFNKVGLYNIVLTHGMRQNPLNGSLSVGVKIIEND